MLTPCDLAVYLNRHAGRPGWVLGGGPSLLGQDPKEKGLAEGVVFATNHQVWTAERLGFLPADYWLALDDALFDREWTTAWGPERIDPKGFPGVSKWADMQTGAYLRGRGLSISNDGLGASFVCFQLGNALSPSQHDTRLMTQMSTVGVALHLAWITGCNPIHVRGLDFGPDKAGRTHWWSPKGVARPADAGAYDFQKDFLHSLVSQMQAAGVTITVKGADWLTSKPYTPPWLRKPGGKE